MPITLVAQGAGTQQHHQRPEPFTTAFNNVIANLVDQGDIGGHLLWNKLIYCPEFTFNKLIDRRQSVDRSGFSAHCRL